MDMKKGFTLIEIMVVIVILGVLITMISGSFVASQKKSRDLKRKSDIVQISKALEIYYNDQGQYPAGSNDGVIIGCDDPTTPTNCGWDEIWSTSTTPETIYMGKLPKDPSTTQTYFYTTDATGSLYKIYARLENTDDGSIGVYTTICGANSAVCNYGVASTNSSP
jgi:type II secretion system protein G